MPLSPGPVKKPCCVTVLPSHLQTRKSVRVVAVDEDIIWFVPSVALPPKYTAGLPLNAVRS